MTLRACQACRRHFAAEPACPFCHHPSPSPSPSPNPSPTLGRLTRAAIFAALSSGCYTSSAPAQNPPPPPPHEGSGDFASAPPATGSARITGTIRDSRTGSPMANVPLQLQSASQPSMPLKYATSDADGRYVFTDVPAGAYYLFWGHANRDGGGRPQQTIDVADGAVITRDLKVYPPPPSNVPMPYGAPPARRRVV